MSKLTQLLNGIRKDCLNAANFSDEFEYSETSQITIYNDDIHKLIKLEYQGNAEKYSSYKIFCEEPERCYRIAIKIDF